MKKVILKIFFLFFFSKILYAGSPSSNWLFGIHAGLTFVGGVPITYINSAMSTGEGSASISDSAGNLLFYTDGSTVYNSQNNIMANGTGLFGDFSSTQSALIVKAPGSNFLYYVFTIRSFQGTLTGCYYSIVDMTLSGGLGQVITKNVLVHPDAREQLTAIRHSNGNDYWILINPTSSNGIYAYHLTSSGLSNIPVVSIFGVQNCSGYLKGNFQNDKLAFASMTDFKIFVLNFNNNTGIATNYVTLQGTPTVPFNLPYGIEFSANGARLYGVTMDTPYKIIQWDLSSGIPSTIQNSATIIASHVAKSPCSWAYYYGAIQMAENGKIYCVVECENKLGVINNPNLLGTFCNYVPQNTSLGSNTNKLGLPNFVPDYIGLITVTLPIELNYFNATVKDKKVFTEWSTSSEINNDHFTIQRSKNATNWESIYELKGKGNTTSNSSYYFYDLNPYNGVSYYRLAQSDFDGKTTYFDPVPIEFENTDIDIFPNPATDEIFIKKKETDLFNVSLFSIDGKKMNAPEMESNNYYKIDCRNIDNGVYFLRIEINQFQIETRKIIVRHFN